MKELFFVSFVIVFYLGFWGGIIYIALHFIFKYW